MTKTLLDKLVKHIPHDWMSTRLKKIAIMEKGKKPDKIIKEYSCGLKPYLTAENMRNNDYTLWCEEGKTIVKSNEIDTLLIWDGSNAGEVFHGRNGIVASTMVKVTPRTENINWKYLFYSISDYNKILRSTTNGTSIPHVSKYVFDNLVIPLPPLSEQQKIVKVLSTVDDVIGKTNAIIEETKQLKKGLMQKLFTVGIGHTRFKETKIGTVPEAWDVEVLQEIAKLITDGKHGDCSNQKDSGFFFISAKDIYNGRIHYANARQITEIDFLGAHKRTQFEPGDILVTNSGTIGKTTMADDSDRTFKTTFQKSVAIIKILPEKINLKYLLYFIEFRRKYLEIISYGSAQKNLLLKDLRKLKVLIPAQDEQRKIAQILSEVDAKIEKEQATKEQLVQLKKGLMQVLLTGKIRVKV